MWTWCQAAISHYQHHLPCFFYAYLIHQITICQAILRLNKNGQLREIHLSIAFSKKNMYLNSEFIEYYCQVINEKSHSDPDTEMQTMFYYTPRTTKLLGGYTGFTPSVRPSVCPSVRPSVRPSRMPCPLCIIFSYGWILFILGTNDHYHERVCRAPWPLTLIYIFKVIWPWLRKSCPLCSVYSSGWILPIFGTNDHYH